jgi:hypothetical protein
MSRPVLFVYVWLLVATPAAAQQSESQDVPVPPSSVKAFLTTIASDFAHVPRPGNLEIFGTAVGIVAGRSVTVRRGHAQFRVAPFAVHAGGGVAFALVPSS